MAAREDDRMHVASGQVVSPREAGFGRFWAGPLRLVLLFVVALLLVAPPASGQDLYGPEAPRDAAYVRLLNAFAEEPISGSVDGVEWGPVGFAEVSPYRIVEPGEHSGIVAGRELSLTTLPESFTTLVALPTETLVLADIPLRDISRGVLSLYNLTDDSALSLRTSDGTVVLPEVAPRAVAGVAISQAEVELVVYAGEEALASLPRQLFERGEAHAVIVMPLGSEPGVVYARAGAER
jgi:hypothetical protein